MCGYDVPAVLQHIGRQHRFKACNFRYGSECYIRATMAEALLAADLLLLRSDPLADIENTDSILGG